MKLSIALLIVIWMALALQGQAGMFPEKEDVMRAVNETVFAGTLTDTQMVHAMRWIAYADARITHFMADAISAASDALLSMYTSWVRGFVATIHDILTFDARADRTHAARVALEKTYIAALCGDESRLTKYPVLQWTCNDSPVCTPDLTELADLQKCTDALNAAVTLETGAEEGRKNK